MYLGFSKRLSELVFSLELDLPDDCELHLSRNNQTHTLPHNLILCPILTLCPELAHHGRTLHINFQRPLHVLARCHDGLFGTGCAPLAVHQVLISPIYCSSFWKMWKPSVKC